MTSTDSHGHPPGADAHNEVLDHEHSDVNVRAILSFGFGLVAIVVVCAVIVRVVFGVLERQAAANDPLLSKLAIPAGQSPPEPVLVTNEPARLAAFRARERQALEGSGWVDQAGGVAHVPVEDAKKLILQRGLPARSTAADALAGTHAPAMGEASGGRTIPTKPAAAAAQPAK